MRVTKPAPKLQLYNGLELNYGIIFNVHVDLNWIDCVLLADYQSKDRAYVACLQGPIHFISN